MKLLGKLVFDVEADEDICGDIIGMRCRHIVDPNFQTII